MSEVLRTVVEQDMTRHTLGHIFAKLKGQRVGRTTFLVVEGADDLAFYSRFFDRMSVAAYYSTRLKNDGTVDTGGCEELQRIVKTVLEDGRTDRVIGIMDADYRRYIKGYCYPQNIFHTDHRDMEMTALSTPSVAQALASWIPDYQTKMDGIAPVLRYVGVMRILNDKYRIGCNFGKKCKIDRLYDEQRHVIFDDWKKRYNKTFLAVSLKNKRKTTFQKVRTAFSLGMALLHYLLYSYKNESLFDVSQGHDTIQLLSLNTSKNSVYSKQAIWEKCFDTYSPDDFTRTRLYADIDAWQQRKGLSLFKMAVA